jgi:membrane protein implicated in regulation of membrane protease activity
MTEAALQILLILAYLAIGLLSVTFPIYALCVTYLKQEKYASERDRKISLKKAKDEIIKLTNEMPAETKGSERFRVLQEKIEALKKESEALEERPYLLSARRAVLAPIICLFGSLFFACIGIYCYYEGEVFTLDVFAFAVASLFFSCLAIIELYQTVCTVEHAALRGDTEIEIGAQFKETETQIQEVKVDQEVNITIGTYSRDMDLEQASIFIYLPPEIEVKTHTGKGIALQPEHVRFPKYNMVKRDVEYLLRKMAYPISLKILVNKTGEYKIPVMMTAKGIVESATELTLRVVQ